MKAFKAPSVSLGDLSAQVSDAVVNISTRQRVAVKQLPATLVSELNPESVADFRREAALMCKLPPHPCVCR